MSNYAEGKKINNIKSKIGSKSRKSKRPTRNNFIKDKVSNLTVFKGGLSNGWTIGSNGSNEVIQGKRSSLAPPNHLLPQGKHGS